VNQLRAALFRRDRAQSVRGDACTPSCRTLHRPQRTRTRSGADEPSPTAPTDPRGVENALVWCRPPPPYVMTEFRLTKLAAEMFEGKRDAEG